MSSSDRRAPPSEVYALVQKIQDLKRSLAGDEQGLFEEVMQGLVEALEQFRDQVKNGLTVYLDDVKKCLASTEQDLEVRRRAIRQSTHSPDPHVAPRPHEQ
ncbi:hypothetical protein CPB85DRAFT_1254998 [Mucidula mucida]|nr:hypothetical protein CPB85DRAFT_1254998 [Mucidula mucida]